MENILLLTFVSTLGMFFLYYMDGKLSEKERTIGDNIKTLVIMGGGIYVTLLNHTVPKKVLKEIVESGPADF